jgi:hypothetical protein
LRASFFSDAAARHELWAAMPVEATSAARYQPAAREDQEPKQASPPAQDSRTSS